MAVLREERGLERNFDNFSRIPRSAGVFVFLEGSLILRISAYGNLQAEILRILHKGKLGSCEHFLRKYTTNFDYFVTGTKLTAYKLEKIMLLRRDGLRRRDAQRNN